MVVCEEGQRKITSGRKVSNVLSVVLYQSSCENESYLQCILSENRSTHSTDNECHPL